MKVLYVVDTPLQLFNCINLQYNKKYDGDLLIINQFHGAISMAKKVASLCMFNSVTLIDKWNKEEVPIIKRKYFSFIYVMFPMYYLYNELNRVGSEVLKNKYSVIVSAIYSPIIITLLRKNPESKLWLIDDGLASYTGNILTDFLKDINKPLVLIYKLFYKDSFNRKPDALFLNNCDYCKNEMNVELRQLPPIDKNILSISDSIFPIGKFYNQPIIWFSIPSVDEMITHKIAQCFCISNLDVIVRMHPRDKQNDIYMSYFGVDIPNDLWETKVLTMDIEKKILVSVFSTAQFVPKYLYNKEPILILLYKLYGFEYDISVGEAIDTYNNSDRIFIPNSLNELRDYLKNI